MKKYFKRVTGSLMAALMLGAYLPALSAAAAPQEEAELGFMQTEYIQQGEFGYVGYEYVMPDGSVYDPADEMLFCSSVNTTLPATYDSREYGIITEPKSQGISGSCWAFAAISALETDSIKKGLTEAENTDFSEAHLAWFAGKSLTANEADPTSGDGIDIASPYKKGGNWKIASAVLARHSGLANESDYPFIGTSLSMMGNYSEEQRYDTSSGVILESAQELMSDSEVKEWVIEHGSVSVSFKYNDEYFHENNKAYCCNVSQNPNHEVVIVGWDDNYSASNFAKNSQPEKDGAWLCKNSWGEYWGFGGGYFYLSYYDATITQFAGYSVRSAENVKNNYSYNGAEWRTTLICNNSMEAANVFKAEGNEKLSSVATYTTTPDTQLTIRIYCHLPENYTKPTQGTKVAEIKTTVHNTGYHTIHLDSPVDLENGCIFSVVVRYGVSSGKISVPFEKNGSNENAYTSRPGESFINTNVTRPSWKESTSYSVQNAYIQAITENGDCEHTTLIPTVITASTCYSQGVVAQICAECGYNASEELIPYEMHCYGEWSEYEHDSTTGKEISRRECTECGQKSERSYVTGNTVAVNDFFSAFFERLIEIIRQLFMSNLMR